MSLVSRITSFAKRFEREISSIIFIGGFIVDNLTLGRIDLLFSNFTIITYLLISGISIVLLTLSPRASGKNIVSERIRPFIRFIMEFSFGGLFSVFFVFYSKSATLISSWPFLLLLFCILIGNEIFKSRYSSLVFQVSVWYFTVLSYLIFILPVITHSISTLTFIQSTFISLLVIICYVICLAIVSPARIKESYKVIAISVLSIFVLLHILFFTNIIPPLPLALKEIGVYHNVEKTPQGYSLTEEKVPWYKNIFGTTYHITGGEPVYVWSSIFAPTKMSTNVYHEWQYYNETKEEWVTMSRVKYLIFGGRDGGYRGYSMKQVVYPGLWRVNVLTINNRVIGRIKFNIESVASPIPQNEIER